jgi:hypothetical protein
VYAPSGVCDIWPLEKEFDRDSYIGVPMFDSTGKIIGHFACMDGKPMRSFAIRMWNVEKNFQDERHFLDRTDGVFEIPELARATGMPGICSAQRRLSSNSAMKTSPKGSP